MGACAPPPLTSIAASIPRARRALGWHLKAQHDAAASDAATWKARGDELAAAAEAKAAEFAAAEAEAKAELEGVKARARARC